MITINDLFDIRVPQVKLPEKKEMLGDFVRVKSSYSFEVRDALYTMAKYFKREESIDSMLAPHPMTIPDDKEMYAYLLPIESILLDKDSLIVGGFIFRLREWGYGFQWIWLHPFVRGKGILTKHWPLLEEKFGKDFYCEPPYSKAMQAFLDKRNTKQHTANGEMKKAPMWYDKVR